jgi:hypothetical protein
VEPQLVFESKNLINYSVDAAIYDRLCSMIYSVLSGALEASSDPKAQLKEWRELGAPAFSHVLLLSASPDWASYPGAFWIKPWVARHLRAYNSDQLTHIVSDWLEGKPLDPRVSINPEDEDLKVRHLESLLSKLEPK